MPPPHDSRRRHLPRINLLHPARLVAFAFASAIAIGTMLLSLPAATSSGTRPPFVTALFTATSATCVTGLIVVDTPTYWSTLGQIVIAVLIQLGGLGIMSFASILTLTVAQRFGLRLRLAAQAETKAFNLGDVRELLRAILLFVVAAETLVAVALTVRFWVDGEGFARGVGLGVFHAISAFNNAGFALFSDSLARFVRDPWVTLVVAGAVIVGGLGFPVVNELRRIGPRPRAWSLHTKVTVGTTLVLLAVGFVAVLAFEWSNAQTLGRLDDRGKLLASFFQSVTPRTAGFHTLDYGAMEQPTWLVTIILMFIGGGSASTAGGIKVTTFALLGFVIWSELRSHNDVNVFGRRVASATQRQALTVALLAVGLVVSATLALMLMTDFPLSRVLFETVSAFGVVGLSTGVTADLNEAARLLVIGLMFVGRIGPATVGIALVLREHDRHFRYPEERALVG